MRWPWSKREARPIIQPYQPPVSIREAPKEPPGIIVKEGSLDEVGIDVESMTRTGIHKAWKRLTGQSE